MFTVYTINFLLSLMGKDVLRGNIIVNVVYKVFKGHRAQCPGSKFRFLIFLYYLIQLRSHWGGGGGAQNLPSEKAENHDYVAV